jgi:hypothetical protein
MAVDLWVGFVTVSLSHNDIISALISVVVVRGRACSCTRRSLPRRSLHDKASTKE